MTSSFPVLFKYETISFKDWDTVSFLEKNMFFRNVTQALTDQSHVFPQDVDDLDGLVEILDQVSDDTKWFITVDNVPAGVWFFKETPDGIVVNFYLLPHFKSLEAFFSSFFYQLDSSTEHEIFIDLTGYPDSRVGSFVTQESTPVISGKKLNSKIVHPHIEVLLNKLKDFYN